MPPPPPPPPRPPRFFFFAMPPSPGAAATTPASDGAVLSCRPRWTQREIHSTGTDDQADDEPHTERATHWPQLYHGAPLRACSSALKRRVARHRDDLRRADRPAARPASPAARVAIARRCRGDRGLFVFSARTRGDLAGVLGLRRAPGAVRGRRSADRRRGLVPQPVARRADRSSPRASTPPRLRADGRADARSRRRLLAIGLLPAIAEELVFRGVLARALASRFPARSRSRSRRSCSRIYHLPLAQMVPTFMLGLALGFLTLRARLDRPGDGLPPAQQHDRDPRLARDELPSVTRAGSKRIPVAMLVAIARARRRRRSRSPHEVRA